MTIAEKTYSWDDTGLITVELAKHNLRVDHALDDAEIGVYIQAAYQDVESYLNRVLLNQEVRYLVNDSSSEFSFTLSQPDAFNAVGDVIIVATDGTKHTATSKTLSFDGYCVTVSDIVTSVTVEVSSYEVVIDYTPKLLNDVINQAVYLTITNYYENRNSVIVGASAKELPMGVDHIVRKYKYQVI